MDHQKNVSSSSGLEEHNRILSLLDERRFEEAQTRGRVLLESNDLSLKIRARTHNLVCWTFIEGLKRPSPEAVLHGEEAVRLARDEHDGPLVTQFLFNLAAAYLQTGDYASARAAYDEILALLAKDSSLLPHGVILALTGLAAISRTFGRLQESLAHLDQAQAACSDPESIFLLPDLYRRKAQIHCSLGQIDLAVEAFGAINEEHVVNSPRGLWWKTHLLYTKARIALAKGELAQARQIANNCVALAKELGDLPVLAEANATLSLVDQAEGRREAHKRARLALTHAIHSGRRDVVDDLRGLLKSLLVHEL
jgi:tetratricopeptide (TPR) repeat protein